MGPEATILFYKSIIDLTPTKKDQDHIYDMKANEHSRKTENLLTETSQHLIDKGAELIIMGCSEIPLAFNPDKVDLPVLDSIKILARKAIEMYTKNITHKNL